MGTKASLTYKDSNGEECVYKLRERSLTIGRLDENGLAIDNPYISRFHAEISFDGSFYFVTDLGSTSGSFLNDQQIKHSVLKDGDRIRLGRGHGLEFVFNLKQSSEEAELPAEDIFVSIHPVRVIAPEEARYINVSKLPDSGELADETVDRLRALYEFTSEVLTSQSPDDLCDRLASFLHKTIRPERCAVLIHNRHQDSLELKASCPPGLKFKPSRSITNRVYRQNVAVFSLDAQHDKRFAEGESVRFQAIRSVICAPIGSKSRLWGVCYVDNVSGDHSFDDEELEFLTALARQVGLALENLYLLEEQRHSLESFIRTLAASLDARDDNTAGHSARVGVYAAGIARVMGLTKAQSRSVYYAGLLHDYGKIGIRDDILLKPASLTTEEYERIKEHPQHTFKLLSKIRFPEDLADIPYVAAAHHERWDGTGYPHGLHGEEIPIGSRIVAVADAFDALVEERVYNEPILPRQALEELTKRSGFYFDPKVIEAFTEYFAKEIEPRRQRLEQTLASGTSNPFEFE